MYIDPNIEKKTMEPIHQSELSLFFGQIRLEIVPVENQVLAVMYTHFFELIIIAPTKVQYNLVPYQYFEKYC